MKRAFQIKEKTFFIMFKLKEVGESPAFKLTVSCIVLKNDEI